MRAPPSRAAVLEASRQIRVREVRGGGDVPTDGGWIRVDACGMCGSDWNWYANREVERPFIPGHEIVGTVMDAWGDTAASQTIAPGARIVLEEAIPCHNCPLCHSGRHRLCPYRQRYGGIAVDRAPALWGGYSEIVYLAPSAVAHPVPAALSSELATLFIALSNGLSWLRSSAGLIPGESVLVIGVGQHGLATVAAARRLAAGSIWAAGRTGDAKRFEAARALGADEVIDVDQRPLREAVRDLAGPGGVDVIVDLTPGATSVAGDAVALAAVGGRIIVAGIKNAALSQVDTDRIQHRELILRGVSARESWAIDVALSWLASDPSAFEPFGMVKVGLEGITDALLALGGERGADRPLHAVIDPRS